MHMEEALEPVSQPSAVQTRVDQHVSSSIPKVQASHNCQPTGIFCPVVGGYSTSKSRGLKHSGE